MAIVFQYTGTEAVEMVKQTYPNDWLERLNKYKNALITLSRRHNLSVDEAYKKFIMKVSFESENILFFAALSQLMNVQKMSNSDKTLKIHELEDKREGVANQIIALENNKIEGYEDKKILRGYYTKLQQELTAEINELINSFQVVEPLLIIHQPGLFDQAINS